ncbi:unnamed protein product [Bursaphelenchus okinawaensis]|uniref:Uncharacterized protein n=1 Tax=Bursaphelenchus okinawaensis TaxID=465554 RepID=A0A811KUP1_9BILA|nr:unnamed protein product [Bursaphelenchus okinawaensis]CAG9112365.1 unnamed protein product [Bursaphelenchus okinawaensis]
MHFRKMSSVKSVDSFSSYKSLLTARPVVLPPLLLGTARNRYLGVRTKSEAVASIRQRTDFRLYHLWNPQLVVEKDDQLPLTIVYKSSQGVIFHWPIKTIGHIDKFNKFMVDFYFVETHGPTFKDLTNLVDCYETKQYCDSGEVDVFRCNKTD